MKANTKKLAIVCAIDITLKILLLAQIKSAQKEGYIIHGICTKGPSLNFLQKNNIKMYPVTIKRSISPLSDLIALWKMYRYFKSESIDIVHTHTPKCSLLGQLAAKLAGVPIIINTVHGFYFHDNMKPFIRRFYVAIELIAAKCSTMLLSQNPEDIETAVELGICKRDKIKLLGNGVDLSKFDPGQFDTDFRTTKRAQIGLPNDAIVVGIIGRLVREKGFIELFKAMQKIMASNNQVWLLIIGPEDPEKTDGISPDTIRQYNIQENTQWLDYREDIPELLACCDIYTLPSWREGFPRSAIEAAAMGLPIVATNIRGCRQVVDDGLTGLLVPLHDINALIAGLEKLIYNKDLRDKMGQAGYKKARQAFDEQRVCYIVINTYRQLIEDKANLKIGNN
jgi:glycosyltransferase involved in cell wall biosynthesis